MLLISESQDEFAKMTAEFLEEIRPEGLIEQSYVKDIAYYTLEILRYRRAKAGIINAVWLRVLRGFLATHLPLYQMKFVEHFARGWFDHAKTKAEVIKLLKTFGLDETAIAAEAFRLRAKEIEICDRLEALAEARREKSLHVIGKMRKKLGKRLRQRSDDMLANVEIPTLVPTQREVN
jgi:hypothetical protein